MEIELPVKALNDAVRGVRAVASGKSALPILSHLFIEATDESIRLVADDLRMRIESKLWANVKEAGIAAIPAARLSAMLSNLPESDISIVTDEKSAGIVCAGIETHLFCMDASEFPARRPISASSEFTISSRDLADMIEKTIYAVSTDQARFNLSGVFFDIAPDGIALVGLDGSRMGLARHAGGVYPKAPSTAIVPASALREVVRAMGGTDAATIRMGEGRAQFDIGDTTILCALIEGIFPNYKMVSPDNVKGATPAIAPREAVLAALRRAMSLTTDQHDRINLSLRANRLTLSLETPGVGRMSESIGVDYSGGEVSAAFRPVFLHEALSVTETDQASLTMQGGMRPIVIEAFDQKDGAIEHRAVIMPLRDK